MLAWQIFRRIAQMGLGVVGTMLMATVVAAGTDELVLRDEGQETRLSIAALRDQADERFTLYDPFEAADVAMRGLVFRDFLVEHFGEVPEALAFEAWDEYRVTLEGWDDPDWILVTHQNGEPLTLRDRGPLRLVERDYGDRDPENLRGFNDWIWMIRSIEAVP
ncbi:hypothetical protein SAMN04487954_101332 [Billgrantia gudaonensis]|uniref:Oxidoreductase molybdopterin-binding domain-containing protein n=2 Tax=Billgrantia gudaonensis TaxID=376427 RepID=A0A1G8NHF1_9GAMM|nr:hypothetical protein SAMN04487954_101332 [Halomonas gudaonensis]